MSEIDLKRFKEILMEQGNALLRNMSDMEESALRRSGGGVKNLPTHMADISGDTFEQDLTLGLLENEIEVIREINAALERIEEGRYGLCEDCGDTIGLKRLEYVPHARLCITCQKEEEKRNQEHWRYY